jgi:hypothetical protein
MLWKACVVHGAFEYFWLKLLRVEDVSLMTIIASAAWVPHTALGLHIIAL